MDKITPEDVKVLVPQRQHRRPGFVPFKTQPRSRLMQRSSKKQILRSHSSTSKGSCQDRDADEAVEPQLRRLSLCLNVYNSILGGIGLVSALCFGVVTVVQAETANKEARIANRIAGKSLFLGWTCAQVIDVSNSTLCALVEGYVKEAFWPSNGTWSTFFLDGVHLPSHPLSASWGKLDGYSRGDGLRECLAMPFISWESYSMRGCGAISLLGFPSGVLTLRKAMFWIYLLFGWLYMNYPDIEYLGYRDIGSISGGNTGWQLQKRFPAIAGLLLLLWFLASGFALRIRNGGDFVTSITKTRFGQLSALDAIICCFLELYYLIWLDVMIGFMLQNL